MSILKPASFCIFCNHSLSFFEKIPIFSYLGLQGRCFHCDSKIDLRYLVVELLMTLASLPFIFKLIYLPMKAFFEVGISLSECFQNFFMFFFILIFLTIGLAIALIDLDSARIPHSLTYFGIIMAMLFSKIFLGQTFLEGFINFGLIMILFDSFNHFANKLIYKSLAMPICPSAITFRLKSFEKHVSKIYVLIFCLILFLILTANFFVLKVLLAYLGISYFIHEIVFDFYLFKLFSPRLIQKKVEEIKNFDRNSEFFENKDFKPTELKNAWGGGDTMMIAFITAVATVDIALAAISISFLLFLILHSFSKNKAKSIRLGPALALALFIAMILRV